MQIENITIGEIWGVIIALMSISAAIGGIIVKGKQQKNNFEASLAQKFCSPLEQKMTQIDEKFTALIKDQDLRNCRTQLIMGFNELRNAAELGQEISDVYKQNIYDQYTHYCSLGGNSYVHSEFEKLKKEGLL